MEGVAQGDIDILVCCAIGMKTVGVDLRTGHAQVNFDEVGCPRAAMRTFERHVALRDPLAEALQSATQFPRAILEGAAAVDVTKG
jgi:hypothetical protein